MVMSLTRIDIIAPDWQKGHIACGESFQYQEDRNATYKEHISMSSHLSHFKSCHKKRGGKEKNTDYL